MINLQLLTAQMQTLLKHSYDPDQRVGIAIDIDGEQHVYEIAGWALVQKDQKSHLCFLSGKEVINRPVEGETTEG